MKMIKRIICICLILATAAASFTSASADAAGISVEGNQRAEFHNWNGIDLSPISEAIGYRELTLTISGDMVFKGFLTGLTKEELDRLCQEALEFLGETAENVRKGQEAYDELVKATKEMYEKICKEFGTEAANKAMLDAALSSLSRLGGPIGSTILANLEAQELSRGGGDAGTWVSMAGNTIGAGGSVVVMIESSVGAGLSFAGAATLLTTIASSIAKVGSFRSMVSRVMALEQSLYVYADFLDILQRKIAQLEDYKKGIIVFNNAKATRQFEFLDTQFDEKWTLNMVLTRTMHSPAGIPQYAGQYTIDIEYDLTKMADTLRKPLQEADPPGNYSVANSGAQNANRTLTGSATALINVSSMSITPDQDGDKKNVNVAGIVIHCQYDSWSYDVEYFADEDNVFFGQTNIVAGPQTESIEATVASQGYPWPFAWEEYGNIYKRGDDATSGWTLTSP